MSESLILLPSRKKLVSLLLGSLLFVVGGAWMIADGERNGWFAAGFFAICAFVVVIQLLPGASYLKLDSLGFTACTLFRKNTVLWSHVQNFDSYVVRYGHTKKMVGFNYKRGFAPQSVALKLAVQLSGFEGGLPDTYGKSAEDLVRVLNEWRGRYSS
jgi:hypothetical protein